MLQAAIQHHPTVMGQIAGERRDRLQPSIVIDLGDRDRTGTSVRRRR
jgi:hypothetical protein